MIEQIFSRLNFVLNLTDLYFCNCFIALLLAPLILQTCFTLIVYAIFVCHCVICLLVVCSVVTRSFQNDTDNI